MQRVTTFGEVLLRLSTMGDKLLGQSSELAMHFGGSELNVAISLAKMGIETNMVTALPGNDLGLAALNLIKSHGVNPQIVMKENSRLGLYFLQQGASFRAANITYDRQHSAFSQLEKGDINWQEVFGGSSWFHVSGISAAVTASAAEVCLEAVTQAKNAGLRVSIDLNYRKNLWKYGKKPVEVMPSLVQHADLLLGDPATINLMLGTNIPVKDYYAEPTDLLASYVALQQQYPSLHYVGMTLRDVVSSSHNIIGGALYAQGKMYASPKIPINPIVERIGGGDAFMAGLIYGLLTEAPLQYTVEFATIASALKLTIPGDFNLFSKSEIEHYMHADLQGKINR